MNKYSIYTDAFATDAKLPCISLREVKMTGDLDIFEWFSEGPSVEVLDIDLQAKKGDENY